MQGVTRNTQYHIYLDINELNAKCYKLFDACTGRTGMTVIALMCALYGMEYVKGGVVEKYVNDNTKMHRQSDVRGWFQMPETQEQCAKVGEVLPYAMKKKR